MGRDGRRFDVSRGYLLRTLDASLRRLGVDHVDLWQVHVWSDETPLEETLSALDHAVTTGRASYVGVSNYTGWQSAQAATWQRAVPGRAALASNQVEYSLLNRASGGRGRARPPRRSGSGMLAWSPLGRGVLTGKYRTRHAGRLPRGLAALRRLRAALPRRAQRPRSSRRSPGRPTAWTGRRSRWRWPGSATGRASRPRSWGHARRLSCAAR